MKEISAGPFQHYRAITNLWFFILMLAQEKPNTSGFFSFREAKLTLTRDKIPPLGHLHLPLLLSANQINMCLADENWWIYNTHANEFECTLSSMSIRYHSFALNTKLLRAVGLPMPHAEWKLFVMLRYSELHFHFYSLFLSSIIRNFAKISFQKDVILLDSVLLWKSDLTGIWVSSNVWTPPALGAVRPIRHH